MYAQYAVVARYSINKIACSHFTLLSEFLLTECVPLYSHRHSFVSSLYQDDKIHSDCKRIITFKTRNSESVKDKKDF